MKSALAAAITSKVLVGGAAVAAVAATSTGIALVGYHGVHGDPPTPQATLTTHSASATPSPNLAGLCTAYQDGSTSNSGKAIDNPAFQALVTAAGGADQVDAYCATLVSTAPTASGTPSPNLVGLCTAYEAGVSGSSGKAVDDPAFQALVTAAGGADQVDAFCAPLIHAPPTQATEHPTGKPTALPTQATEHPTGEASGAASNRP